MMLEIVTAGALTTVQDMGREGYARFGYRRSGACDKYALQMANLLAGNLDNPELPVLEFTLCGGVIRFLRETVIALTGADMQGTIDGIKAARYQPVTVKAGQTLVVGNAVKGLRAYLAVNGGIQVPQAMESGSTDVTVKIGGKDGRALKAGDRLESGSESCIDYINAVRGREDDMAVGKDKVLLRNPLSPWRSVGGELIPVLRVVKGPQEEYFTDKGMDMLERSLYRVSPDSNRMAVRLSGNAVEMKGTADIISDPIVEGSIQIASGGLPMVMLADHQTTGGYAKIGTVVRADLSSAAQRRPGEGIGFQFVTVEEAVRSYRKEKEKLRRLKEEMLRVLERRSPREGWLGR